MTPACDPKRWKIWMIQNSTNRKIPKMLKSIFEISPPKGIHRFLIFSKRLILYFWGMPKRFYDHLIMFRISEVFLMFFHDFWNKTEKMSLAGVLKTSGLKKVLCLQRAWSTYLPAAVIVYKAPARIIFCTAAEARAAKWPPWAFNVPEAHRASSVWGIYIYIY